MYLSPGARPISGQLSSSNSVNLDLSVKEKNDKRLSAVVEWLNSMCPHQKLSSEASEEELRVFLKNGTVFCDILNKISPDSVPEDPGASAGQSLDYVKKFLLVIEDMGLPGFEVSDLEKGSMKAVVECLLILRDDMNATDNHDTKSTTKFKRQLRRLYLSEIINGVRMNRSMQRLNSFPEERSCSSPDTKFQRVLQSPIAAEPPTAMLHHAGQKFHEVFQLKQGRYSDLPAARISEMMKLNSLDNAPTQSLMSVVNGILDESIERKNGEIPQRVACLLRKVVHEIERRISTQAQHIRNQNNLIKAREERYLSRIKVLEALATGTNEESQLIMNQLKQIKNEKARIEDTKKLGEQDFMRLTKEKKNGELAISKLKEEIETTKRTYEERCLQLEKQAEETQLWEHGVFRPAKDKESSDLAILALKEELETTKRTSEERCFQLKKQAEETQLREHDVVRLAKDKESSDLAILALKEELETTKRTYEERCFQLKNQAEETQVREHDVVRLTKDKESSDLAILALKEELQTTKRTYEEHCLQLEKQAKETQLREHDVVRLTKDKESSDLAILALKEELQTTKRTYEERCLQLEKQAKESKVELEEKLKEVEYLLTELRNRKELEAISASKIQTWNEKERSYQSSIGYHFQMLQELRASSGSIKNEINNAQQIWQEEFSDLWSTLKQMANATENYQIVLSENRKLYNDVQDLKGKIRVYCRIRPFLPGQTGKQSTIDYIGEDGELIVANPSKQGKDGQRMFKFNKVFGPMATQEEVFLDTRPLIRTILDGYNVCIFAYGQTGSGKTYTMTGPETQSKETWGVNYRALNDLFEISQNRSANFRYEVGVQMVEIYNEQVRDLLGNDGSHKRLGICSTSQPNGLAVPDASMHPVNSTTNVLELMQIGHMNRTVGATALNIRSSRSHSVVSVHVRGTNLETGVTLRGSLHLVDLAGSERVDRSEATGERLKEAQHINKSLSALGDVIFALAQKSLHVPYRNSKLTQILQSSLGGQAKTLMFVQLNPDLESYSETLSTLKFAERVSGIELGTSRSNKEGKDVRELMEQVASLKDAITKKDEEIEQLHHFKDPKTQSHNVHSEKRPTSSVRHIASVPKLPSPHGGPPRRSRTQSTGRQASNSDNSSEHSDRQSEASFHHPSDDFKQKKEASGHSKLIGEDTGQNFTADVEIVGLRHTRSDERLSDISVGGVSMGAENDGCVEFTIQSEGRNHDEGTQKMTRVSSFPQSPQRSTQTTSTRVSPKVSTKGLTSVRKAVMAHESISSSKASQRWQ